MNLKSDSSDPMQLHEASFMQLANGRPNGTGWKVSLFVVGLATVAAALTLRPVLRARMAARAETTLAAAQEALESGDTSHALALAQSVLKQALKTHRQLAASHMTLGLVREQQGETSTSADRLLHFAAALQHFAEAERSEIPQEDRGKLAFHKAKCLFARNQIAECLPILQQTVLNYPPAKAESLRLLTLAYQDPVQSDLDQALRTNSELLSMSGLTPEQVMEAWKTRKGLVERLGRVDLLGDLDISHARNDLGWVCNLVLAVDAYQDRRYDIALKSCTDLVRIKGLPHAVERRVWYLMGMSEREKGDVESALATFRTVEWRYPNTDESRAAATTLGGILLAKGEIEPAVAALSRAAQQMASASDSQSSVPGVPSLERVLAAAVDRLQQQDQFKSAADLIESYRLVASASSADSLAAHLYELWAAATLQQAKAMMTSEATQMAYRAEELFRIAGTFHARVADGTSPPEAAARILWQAARDFVQGRGYLQAVNALECLLATGVTGDLRANALALACSALESCRRVETVYEVAAMCVAEFPNHSATATACYYLARCQIASGDLASAATNLKAILNTGPSDTDPAILQQTRLILAHLLTDQGRGDEAIPRINDLLATPSEPDVAREARLLLSGCLRRRACGPAGRMQESHNEEARLHFRQLKEADIAQALQLLTALERDLFVLEQANCLSPVQADWLHDCRWGIADCEFDADHYESALKLYESLSEIYTDPSEWLEAEVQIANCHYRVKRVEAARAVMRAARVRMSQLSDDAVEQVRVGMSPGRWNEWTEWVRQL